MLKSDQPALTLLLGALVAIAPLAMDIYLPSMPSMTYALHATSDEVQLTLSVYMFGWGAAQLLGGPLSDRFGRRPALLGGLVLFTLASVACALAPNIGSLIVARFFQAVSMATVAVVPRAVVRDLHSGDRAAHMLSTMMLVLGIAPVVAPVLGAELHVWLGWQANFAFVALYGALAWVAVQFGLPETLQTPDPSALDPSAMVGNWRRALASRRYVGFLLTIAFSMAGLFAFLAGSAFVFVEGLGKGERVFSMYFGLVMLGTFVGSTLARRALHRTGLEQLVQGGTMLLLLAGIAMAALAWLGVHHPLAIIAPMFVFMAAYMWTVPQATAGALTPFPEIAGSAEDVREGRWITYRLPEAARPLLESFLPQRQGPNRPVRRGRGRRPEARSLYPRERPRPRLRGALAGGGIMKETILFICVHNSARSQIAEGLVNALHGDRFAAVSGGTMATRVHPGAIQAMAEIGIDISGHRSKSIDEFEGRRFDHVVMVCDESRRTARSSPAEKNIFTTPSTIRRPAPAPTKRSWPASAAAGTRSASGSRRRSFKEGRPDAQ